MSALLPSKMGGNSSSVGRNDAFLSKHLNYFHWSVMSQVCVLVCVYRAHVFILHMTSLSATCESSLAQLSRSSIQYSFYWQREHRVLCLFTGRFLSLYLLTQSGTEDFWKPATVTVRLTGAELRLTIRSQTYRALC